ncbi:MAG TPA: copper chaperone PCu(A)C [Methyloceanibacter sp.]|jgi:copper(I)-binding protein|nr:copper chaperone PCu(A)C [Methyloceanibacter sp.]
MMAAFLRAVALAVAVLSPAGVARAETAGAIAVENAWSREVPAGASVGVGYLAIRNSGDEPDRLVSASTSVAGETEIHQTTMADGVMRMRPVPDGVPVPAKGSVMLEPNGYHFMFMGLTRPLKEGDAFPAKLVFERAGSIEVTFQVLGIGAQGPKAE